MILWRHGRKGGDGRGNSSTRRARKLWLLSPASGHGGDGISVPCRWCRAPLSFSAVEADRWPIEGRHGGRYIRSNIVPACRACNAAHSTLRIERRFAAVAARLRLAQEAA